MKKHLNLLSSQIQKTRQNVHTVIKKKKLPKTSLNAVTTNVWVLSTSLEIVYSGHPEITDF